MGVSMERAAFWVERWERQQQRYAADREERFAVIADVVEHVTAGQAKPLLLDLGCGPGSLAARLAQRLPGAEIVAVDMDPLLLELGRTHYADAARYVEAALGSNAWIEAASLDQAPDAALSATALHCLPEETLLRTYEQIAALLRPGGVLVNADQLPRNPRRRGALSEIAAHVERRRAERLGAHDHEDWDAWWAAAAQDPELAAAFDVRNRRFPAAGSAGDNDLYLSRHVQLLRRAGFHDVTTVWQYGDSHVLVAIKQPADADAGTPQRLSV